LIIVQHASALESEAEELGSIFRSLQIVRPYSAVADRRRLTRRRRWIM